MPNFFLIGDTQLFSKCISDVNGHYINLTWAKMINFKLFCSFGNGAKKGVRKRISIGHIKSLCTVWQMSQRCLM